MNVDEIVVALARLGMPDDEARVYTYLRVLGPSKASDVADATNLSRARTYRALEALGSRSFVSTGVGRPRMYKAADLDAVFERLRQDSQDRIYQIDNAARELPPVLQELERGYHKPLIQPRFDIVRTRPAIHAHLRRLCDEAGMWIDLLFAHPAALGLLGDAGVVEALKKSVTGGVRVRVILGRSGVGNLEFVRGSGRGGVRMLGQDMLGWRLTADGQQAVVGLVEEASRNARSDGPIAFATDAPEFVRTEAALFEALWNQARKTDDEPPEAPETA